MALVCAVAAGGFGVAAPAYAVTFADYFASSTDNNMQWTQGSGATGGVLSTTGTPGAAVGFEFLTPSLSGLGALPAIFVYEAHGTGAAGSGFGYLFQNDLSGTFNFIYNGAPLTVNGHTYTAGASLLSGDFTGAGIVGQNGSSAGNANDATLSGGTITFHSPFFAFDNTQQKSYSIEMTSIAFPLNAVPGQSLDDFGAVSTGSFEAGIATGGNFGIPETATWAMMLIGVGGIGLALRRSRRGLAPI
jgi:hypothetical protein